MSSLRILALSAAALVACGAASAKWKPEYGKAAPEVQAWFKQQHNSRGEWCCNESDGHPYYGDYKINDDGSVTVDLNGDAHTLPAYMILKGPNPTGHAVWWYLDVGQTHRDYCFAPGTLG
jgi:hypothetical protein